MASTIHQAAATPTTTASQPTPQQKTPVATVQEVFSSIQGEGIFIGQRQLFVRFAHCHLKCAYCDTTMTTPDGLAHIETTPGSASFTKHSNPMTPESLSEIIIETIQRANTRHHHISLTGGEPLLYDHFIKEMAPSIIPYSKLYLETSGTQPERLLEVLPWIDTIAMDIKLPSATGEPAEFEAHKAFLDVAQSNTETTTFVKLVFGHETPDEEWNKVIDTVVDRDIPIILQPVTSKNVDITVRPKTILSAEARLSSVFNNVRVIPQTHKMLHVQ